MSGILLFAASPRGAPPDARLAAILSRPVTIREGIGRVSDPVSTRVARAQSFYNQGVAYLHSFVWIEAARSFHEALRADPGLAMGYTGLSYALGELGLVAEAREASHQAALRTAAATGRERLLIELRERQLEAAERPGDESIRIAYRRQLDDIAAKYPDDVEVLLLVGQAQDPSPGDHGMGVGSRSLPFYERALARAPDYFAVHHFIAHASENTGRMNEALAHAQRYAQLAGAVPHAHHMYGHVLRRVDRMAAAIVQFAEADRLAVAFLSAEDIPAEYDWHYRHNLNLLGTAYQYRGQMKAAEPVLRRSFEIDSIDRSTSDLNRKDWLMFLLARNRGADALSGARTLAASSNPLAAALGHIFASRALSAREETADAAEEGNTALRQMRAAGPGGGVLVPEFQLAQGEFLLRSGQLESGRSMIRDAAMKLQAQSGPDAWIQTLFSLEAAARAARAAGDWALARELAVQMVQHDPAYAGTQFARGLSAEHDGNRVVARTAFGEAVSRWADGDGDLVERRDAARRLAALER